MVNWSNLSFVRVTNDGRKRYEGVGENGERLYAFQKPGESEPSLKISVPKPIRTEHDDGLGQKHTTEARTVDVYRGSEEPQTITSFINEYTRRGVPERKEAYSISELTGRMHGRVKYHNKAMEFLNYAQAIDNYLGIPVNGGNKPSTHSVHDFNYDTNKWE